jgi:hypothetical protein
MQVVKSAMHGLLGISWSKQLKKEFLWKKIKLRLIRILRAILALLKNQESVADLRKMKKSLIFLIFK